MTNLFSQPKIPKDAPPQQPPGITDPQTRSNAQASSPNAPIGYGSTILTSGQGDTSQASIQKKQLSGG